MAITINAQFNKFVQFAQQQPNAATSKAIARVTGNEDALAGRSISASNTDHVRGVFNWGGRSGTDAEKNNETRKLFFKSVADIFGGEKNIPQAVKDVMKLDDYGTKEDPSGKPLTARRIMAVNKAIVRFAVEDTVNDVARYVDDACKQTAYRSAFTDPIVASVANLTPAQRRQAIDATLRHSKGLSVWGAHVLARYAVAAIVNDYNVDAVLRLVKPVIAPFRDIPAGDPGFKAVSDRIFERFQETFNEYMSPEKESHFNEDGLFETFSADSDRNVYTMNGKVLPKNVEEVENELKSTIKNIRHRKAISCFLSQMSQTMVLGMGDRLEEHDDVMNIEGAESLISSGGKNSPFDGLPAKSDGARYKLEVSEDGKRAKVTTENMFIMTFNIKGASVESNFPVGNFTWKQEFVFDLSGDEPVMTEARIIQEL